MALPPQQFCVRWNSYHTNLQAVFPRLLLTEQFADVTLACEAKQLRCHKLVLSACSAYLERLLLQNPCDHPIVLMRDMRFSEMQALVDFMYKGEVNVTQEELPSLLKSAEALQIRGLCSGETNATGEGRTETRDFTLASDALVANVHKETPNVPPQQQQHPQQTQQKQSNSTNGPKKRKSEDRDKPEVKEETVEEDGLYYGELDNDHLEYNEDEESGKPGSSLGQTSGKYIRVKPESELIFNLNTNDAENDFYKSWLEKNGELEVSVKPKVKKRGRPPIFKEKCIDLDKSILKSDLEQFLEGKEVSSSGVFRKDLERIMMGKFNPNRRYSNEAMWAALMDVKKGGSIYRAAQTHKVPRKSLRNWMKRCHIKSSFPMPQQLKQFVENSKKQRELPEKTQNYTDIDFEFAIANVQCQYECSDTETEERSNRVTADHNYDTRDEPPAFIIHQIPASSTSQGPFVEVRPGVMTLAPGPGCVPAVNVIHIPERSQITNNTNNTSVGVNNSNNNQEYNMSMNKRIRRSEVVLRQAADCVSRGSTFQTVSEQFNIPISTIRFFMARKGILPRRRRGRSTHSTRACSSPEEPPFHMQHFKLPDMLALQADDEPNP